MKVTGYELWVAWLGAEGLKVESCELRGWLHRPSYATNFGLCSDAEAPAQASGLSDFRTFGLPDFAPTLVTCAKATATEQARAQAFGLLTSDSRPPTPKDTSMQIIFYFVGVNLLLWIGLSIYLLINTRKTALLNNQALGNLHPSLAVVIAVRDEEEHLRDALTSVCNLDYPDLKIIVVNDRSTDQTGVILEQLALSYPQLVIETISSLPPLWLGKTHALYKGALKTSAEWILFTDADVIFHPESIKKSMSYALKHQLDHLTILPEVKSRSVLLNAVLASFQLMLEIKLRPWAARNSQSDASIGVGAFNLIKTTAYHQIGTHERIKLRPDDDLQLGKAIKQAGLKLDVLYGNDQVSLEWYPSIRAFIQGLMKNTFSAFNYNLISAVGAALGAFLIFALPIPLGLLSGNPASQIVALLIVLIQFVLFASKKGAKNKWWYSLTIPYAGLLMSYITLKATILTLKNKGIYWRDTFYALKDLRLHK